MDFFNNKLSRVLNEVFGRHLPDYGDRGRRRSGSRGMRPKQWSKVPGSIVREIGIDENGRVCDLAGDWDEWVATGHTADEQLGFLANIITQDGELVIHYESTGYYDQGNGWDYPPEGDDERTVTAAEFLPAEGEDIRLPPEVLEPLGDVYSKIIDDDDIDYDEPDEDPDAYDRMRDDRLDRQREQGQ